VASKIKRGDRVIVTAGKDKGKEGKVLSVNHKDERIIVEGANLVKKHKKRSRQNTTAGIITTEAPMHLSNVAYVHKGEAVRVGFDVEVKKEDGATVKTIRRIAKPSGDVIDETVITKKRRNIVLS
jgi:large subunit ribosomal protein L24